MAKRVVSSAASSPGANAAGAATDLPVDLAESACLQQYEVVWIWPAQYQLPGCPEGFGLEIRDFLGAGDLDDSGQHMVWVRGLVVEVAVASSGVRLVRGEVVTLPVPHDQPLAWRMGGQVLPPLSSGGAVGAVSGAVMEVRS
jgi:hypothetical protein